MRHKLAWCLRKWADVIDPRTPPSSGRDFSLVMSCDTSEFDAAMLRANAALKEFVGNAESAATVAASRIAQHQPGLSAEMQRCLVYFIKIAEKTQGADVWRALFSEALKNYR
jgi:hypothetical protein